MRWKGRFVGGAGQSDCAGVLAAAGVNPADVVVTAASTGLEGGDACVSFALRGMPCWPLWGACECADQLAHCIAVVRFAIYMRI